MPFCELYKSLFLVSQQIFYRCIGLFHGQQEELGLGKGSTWSPLSLSPVLIFLLSQLVIFLGFLVLPVLIGDSREER